MAKLASPQHLHKAQASILRDLRHTPTARYSTLRQPTGLESDSFKFHLRKLVDQGYVQKLPSGDYSLTAIGKEYANNLDTIQQTIQKQPKLSVVVVASRRSRLTGDKEYLFQQRLRSPFYGYWGCISGPVRWGESLEAAARRELSKQTGYMTDCAVRAFYRKVDHATDTDDILEDKLFAIVEATITDDGLDNSWPWGKNAWMAVDELAKQDKYFASTYDFIDMLEQGQPYETNASATTTQDY